MKILICDDEYTNLEILKKYITEYTAAHCIKADIYATASSKDVFESSTSYDLAFLDIQMPDIDGISVAKELKNRNQKVVIFFVTAFDEYKALQYIDETYIDLFLYNSGEDKKILVDDIMYIRRESRKIILHTKDGNEYITRRSLNEWMEELPNTFFYLVHKSFLVNLHYITKNSYSNIVLDNTIEIPVASRKQVDFHKYWFQYLKRR